MSVLLNEKSNEILFCLILQNENYSRAAKLPYRQF